MTIELIPLLIGLAFALTCGSTTFLFFQVRRLRRANRAYIEALNLSVGKLVEMSLNTGASPLMSNVPVLGCGCANCTKKREQEGADEGIAKA